MRYKDKTTGNTLTVNNKTVLAMIEKYPGRYERLGETTEETAKNKRAAKK